MQNTHISNLYIEWDPGGAGLCLDLLKLPL